MATQEKHGLNGTVGGGIGETARARGLDPVLLYETVIALADEGMLTARCINAAAGILLEELGLPEYYFRNITRSNLRDVLHALARNLTSIAGGFRLSEGSARLRCAGREGLEVLIGTTETRGPGESIISSALADRRWEYYCSPDCGYTTYIVKPDTCPEYPEASVCPFAFGNGPGALGVPEETSRRYEEFLQRHRQSVARIVDFSESTSSKGHPELRVMFHRKMSHPALPVVRKCLADRGLQLNRAYGEPYRTREGAVAAICSLYIDGRPDDTVCAQVAADLRVYLALGENPFAAQYLSGEFSIREMAFAVNAHFFVHQFIYREDPRERQIIDALPSATLQEAFATRVSDANRNEFLRQLVVDAIRNHPDMLKRIYALFESRFSAAEGARAGESAAGLQPELDTLAADLERRLVEDRTGADIFLFMTRLVTNTLKTNFFKDEKRSFAFRFDSGVLDPVVFPQSVFGIFFVVGHFSLGTHMRAEDIARGGLRLLRVTPGSYENQLDDANILNYALGPRAQRLKHKDIAESGSKGVIVPTPAHAHDGLNAVFDYTEGILDLVLPDPQVIDHYGQPEMVFFGPDEGTAPFMDPVAERARERGYAHWRTMTTGKSIGVPHDAYGRLKDGRVFGLIDRNDDGTELRIAGRAILTSRDSDEIRQRIGDQVATSGMTTTGVMAAFRTLIAHEGKVEEELPLMMTGGPDGDLGANQIQTYRGRICLVIDGGAVLFDPQGLNRHALTRLALNRHARPRLTAAAFPREALSETGFMVSRDAANVELPDGRTIEDGNYFHRTFLIDPRNRDLVAGAGIEAFVPCGGLKDTINATNVHRFLELFRELRFIVEGANVFFDDAARRTIAAETQILQIKDSTANKGGVTCSSIAEILTAFLLGDDYEPALVQDEAARTELVGELLDLIAENARAETEMLLALRTADPSVPLSELSVRTSEQLLALQALLCERLEIILGDPDIVAGVLARYVPRLLVDTVGLPTIRERLGTPILSPYRDAIITKKLASAALYRHAARWDAFVEDVKADTLRTCRALLR